MRAASRPVVGTVGALLLNVLSLLLTFVGLVPAWSAQQSGAWLDAQRLVLYVVLPVLSAATPLARLTVGHASGAAGDLLSAAPIATHACAVLQLRWALAGAGPAYLAAVLLVGGVLRRFARVAP